MSKIEYGIEGAFKVDLYSGEKFHSTTDWFNNFITPTGLMYPTVFSFADCFRYLSLGSSNIESQGSNSLSSLGTTGLASPITQFRSSEGVYQSGQYIGWQGYATGVTSSNCGTVLTQAGPRFYRAWYIPTGGSETTVQQIGSDGLDIGEFMVSPTHQSNPSGKYAFSRVRRNLFIPNGFRAIVSYQLKVNIRNTGATYLPAASFNTQNAEISDPVEAGIVSRWANLSGYFKQVYFGLRAVDNLGFTYIPRFGDGMEPSSRNLSRMVWYLSPDNSQFDVNGSGGAAINSTAAYKSDGLMYHIGRNELSLSFDGVISQDDYATQDYDTLNTNYLKTDLSVTSLPTDISDKINSLSDIRIGSESSPLSLPLLNDYKTQLADDTFYYRVKQDLAEKSLSYATPGANQFSSFLTDFGKVAVFSSNTTKLPFNTGGLNSISGRKKTVVRRSTFSPVSSLGYNTRFGSLVYAYEAGEVTSQGDKRYWPMIDCQFIDSSGKYLLPHYRYITGIYLAERGTGILTGSLWLSGAVNDNIKKFVPFNTFQGGYNQNAPLSHWLTGNYVNLIVDESDQPISSGAAGFLASGVDISPNNTGVTGLTINGTGFINGWGAVYGISVNSGFYDITQPDIALVEHSVTSLLEPDNTGKIYWPYTAPELEVKLYGSGFKFWTPEFGLTVFDDVSNWISVDNQFIKETSFERLTSSYLPATPTTYTKYVTGYTGYVVTTKRFDGNSVLISDIVGNTNFEFTGYAVSSDRNTAGQLKGTVWSGLVPTDNLQFFPSFGTTTLTSAGGGSVKYINKMFSTWNDRGYPNGTGGTPIKANASLNLFFTGFSGSPASNKPLYLTYITGSGVNSIVGYSFNSGSVQITNFSRPSGYPLHFEKIGNYGNRLGVNFAPGNYYGDDFYTSISGGEYPALSMDNGLEMYLDISWSSPCGTASNCTEPT